MDQQGSIPATTLKLMPLADKIARKKAFRTYVALLYSNTLLLRPLVEQYGREAVKNSMDKFLDACLRPILPMDTEFIDNKMEQCLARMLKSNDPDQWPLHPFVAMYGGWNTFRAAMIRVYDEAVLLTYQGHIEGNDIEAWRFYKMHQSAQEWENYITEARAAGTDLSYLEDSEDND